MKKYITVAALLAAGTAFANAGETLNLDSTFSYWESGVAQSNEVSAWDTVYGKTESGITSTQFTETTQQIVNTAGKANTTDYTVLDKTLTLSGLYGGGSLGSGKTYALNTYSFIGRPDTDYRPGSIVLAVFFGDTLVGFSSSLSYVGGSDSTYGCVSFTNIFAYSDGVLTTETLILDVDTSYKFSILSSNGAESATSVLTLNDTNYYSTGTGQLGYGEFKMQWENNTGAKLDGMNNSRDYKKPVVRLSVTAVPEPSAFGMLAGLGALALVASRRRRK